MNIDWSQVVTKAMKEEAAVKEILAAVVAENALRRAIADKAIAPLQDAVDIDEATESKVALLKAWKKYRIALDSQPEEPGYPTEVTWPIAPN